MSVWRAGLMGGWPTGRVAAIGLLADRLSGFRAARLAGLSPSFSSIDARLSPGHLAGLRLARRLPGFWLGLLVGYMADLLVNRITF